MESYQIEKQTSGSYRWRVVKLQDKWPNNILIRKCKTKKMATLIKRIYDGDASAVPEWYRLEAKNSLKEFGDYGAAKLSAYTMGLHPGLCQADPDTGKPIS